MRSSPLRSAITCASQSPGLPAPGPHHVRVSKRLAWNCSTAASSVAATARSLAGVERRRSAPLTQVRNSVPTYSTTSRSQKYHVDKAIATKAAAAKAVATKHRDTAKKSKPKKSKKPKKSTKPKKSKKSKKSTKPKKSVKAVVARDVVAEAVAANAVK